MKLLILNMFSIIIRTNNNTAMKCCFQNYIYLQLRDSFRLKSIELKQPKQSTSNAHNDFIKTAEEVHKIFDMVQHEWFGLILDIGSYRTGDPYEQIKSTIPLAINWQIKENIFENGIEKKVDLAKLFNLIKYSSYKGFIPIETLGKGDPNIKVAAFKKEVDFALSSI